MVESPALLHEGFIEEDPQENLPRDEREYMCDEAGELASQWSDYYERAAILAPDWEQFREIVHQRFKINQDLLSDYNDSPQVRDAIERLNYVFGTLPTALVDTNTNIYLHKQKSKPVSGVNYLDKIQSGNPEISASDNYIFSAEWQAQAIWSLLRFRSEEIVSPKLEKSFVDNKSRVLEKGKTLPELLLPSIARAYGKAMPRQMAFEEMSAILSGLYGPVKTARLANAAGMKAILPPAKWDAEGQIDLMLSDQQTSKFFPLQIKSTVGIPAMTKYFPKGVSLEISSEGDMSSLEWLQFVQFCEKIRSSDEWSGRGVDFIPKNVKIYGAVPDIGGFESLLGDQPLSEEVLELKNRLEVHDER
ncbi:MAG: hypothetical protein Q8Q05_01385 [bacterium]|nr:hypothetical protein [bacterium]